MKNQIRNTSSQLKIAALALLALTPFLAQAHILPGEPHSFSSGFNHPLHGLDHMLAMVAVGLWAAQLGGRALWLVPASFVGFMMFGGAVAMMGVHLPMVEPGILASVLILGMLVAGAARLPLAAAMALTGLFAIFHGHAHGTEIPLAASGLIYALGFALATTLLHACGIGLGLLAQKRLPVPALRFAGAGIVVAGICLCLAA
jgi:urease accessory protein